MKFHKLLGHKRTFTIPKWLVEELMLREKSRVRVTVRQFNRYKTLEFFARVRKHFRITIPKEEALALGGLNHRDFLEIRIEKVI
jgi:bifunctional DNA-binding transcriptional regulator/antitoxin component of YhaV-PrlF toxin-antitoxin module